MCSQNGNPGRYRNLVTHLRHLKPPTTSTRLSGLILFVALGSPVAWADLLVNFDCYNSTTPPPQSSGAPAPASLSVPFSCTPQDGGTVSGTVVAGYLNSVGLGSAVSFNGAGGFYSEAFSFDTLSIGGLAPGTPVALTFNGTLNGSYSEATTGIIADYIGEQLSVTTVSGSTSLLNIEQEVVLCEPFGCSAGASQSGTLAVPLSSTTFVTTVGAALTLSAAFYQQIGGSGSVTDNFLDSFAISDIQVTDPTTGQVLSGVTITGGPSGVPYGVNVVPEPSSLALTLAALMLASVMARKRIGLSKSYRRPIL